MRLLTLLALGVVSCNIAGAAPPASSAQMRRVETGLLPAVVVQDQATTTLSLREQMDALHVPGVSIAVIHGGRVDWAKGYGVTAADGAPVDARTLFQAGSVSKPVAAMAALKLVQDKRLALDAPVNALLKTWKLPDSVYTRDHPVTLRQLLSHSAGTSVHGFDGYAQGAAVPTLQQVLDGQAPANSAPVVVDAPVGERYRYSGGGYTVMQQLLIDVGGKPFPDLLRDSVLAPLRMEASGYTQPLPAAVLAKAAQPHDAMGQPIAGGAHVYPELAAAGLWSNAEDLARYALELCAASAGHGRVLSAASVRGMLTPVRGDYGLGLQIGGHGARRYAYHDGSNAGYKATLVVYPDRCDGAVVLSNGDQGYQLGLEIVRAVAAAYDWPDFRPIQRQAASVDIAVLRRFVGSFAIPELGTFDIREGAGGLQVELRKDQAYPLIPSSEHAFFLSAQDIVIRFDAGQADLGTIDAGSFHAPFRRVPADSAR
ncbi:serine hydrolase [Xanthomonas sp. CFBP 8703]|uniref:Serine hydrolase n=1 Tax=Xanthomonas bonasiae TaxID=2810351 RepID=A0ABS3B185_9XANT|nr:serine hydrolase domain-containing protein [Xanthomonas bonasiae]MBN6100644.1 serine hydrolase [Xanthomonas bonasiae]